ncbi:sigma-70 family RNA polymerase sigma factor (plasmid) [Cereibacter azotoformans]|uniref:RNA polymerase sigma factor n=1 Tax=Cereibacter azotoformans TaxID=43057 RepID=UPI001EEBE938|nr:sigma-70 family RNA polymerase sigma factor [Cereibacter azotoformans]ULB12409.1 sigma-70 family RNA polymerase sigma factor [Cereibacter azotoformans]
MSEREDPHGVFGALISGYDRFTRRLTRRPGSVRDAQDVMQDAWLRLARVQDVEDMSSPAAYVGQVVKNLAIDRLRAQRVWERHFATAEFHDQPADLPSAERIVDFRQRVARLGEIIAELPPRQRQVFLLHKFDGLSHSEIAARLGISRSAVEKLIMKALAQCRDGLGDLLDDL